MNDERNLYMARTASVIDANGSISEEGIILLKEHELEILIGDKQVMKIMCTKQDLKELVYGRLLTEGYIESAEDISDFRLSGDENKAFVTVSGRPGCARSGDLKLEKMPPADYRPEWIFTLAHRFEKGTVLHELTSSTHSCMLAKEGEVLFTCEDIGRHNAIDKAIGFGLISGIQLSSCLLYLSGRVPSDMARKAIAAGIPIVASKSDPTAQALDLAHKYGLLIIGTAYPDSIKVYCGKDEDEKTD
ncbi:MAG: formate dehydrogenase accessory sulfurtransferase FdhD [Lachnospiraceae bacterium]|nr:formate dehydrogenase accessory sulfurtransferase FdhD [Lachnospiraceae bacterium]